MSLKNIPGFGNGQSPRREDRTGFGNGGGLLAQDRKCECGHYEPITKTGVVNSRCRNCGGLPKQTIFGKVVSR